MNGGIRRDVMPAVNVPHDQVAQAVHMSPTFRRAAIARRAHRENPHSPSRLHGCDQYMLKSQHIGSVSPSPLQPRSMRVR